MLFLAVLLVTTSITDRRPTPPQVVALNVAIGLYRERHGGTPHSLKDLEELLSEVWNAQCSIAEIGANMYRVWMGLDRPETYRFVIEYGDSECRKVKNVSRIYAIDNG